MSTIVGAREMAEIVRTICTVLFLPGKNCTECVYSRPCAEVPIPLADTSVKKRNMPSFPAFMALMACR